MSKSIRRRVTATWCMLLMVVPLILPGCDPIFGGQVTLGASSGQPGQYVELNHSSLRAGSTTTVRFSAPGGFEVDTELPVMADGAVRVVVPPLVDDQTGEFITGTVNVSLVGQSAGSAQLQVEAMPALGGNAAPGALLRDVLLLAIEVSDEAEARAAATAQRFPEGRFTEEDLTFFTAQRAAIADMLDELDATGQLVVETQENGNVTLNAAALARVDQLLAVTMLGIVEESGGNTAGILKSANLQGDGSIIDPQALQASFRQVARNVVNGGGAFLGGMTLLVAGGALLIKGAGAVALTGGIVLTVGGAVWAISASGAVNRIGSFVDEHAGPLFNEGQVLLEQGISVGTTALSTLRGKLGQLFSGTSTLFTAKTTYDSFVALECQTAAPNGGNQRVNYSSHDVASFCMVVLNERGQTVQCDDSCQFANDDICDDGGRGSEYSVCDPGTDCADCGPRLVEGDFGVDPGDGDGDPNGDDDPPTPTTGFRVWRVTNYGSAVGGYITVMSHDADQNPPLLSSFPGGGISSETRAELSAVTSIFATSGEAVESVCPRVADFFRPPLASFILMAHFDGVQVGISGMFQSTCE